MNDSKGDHPNSLSVVSQSLAQRERLQSDPADLGDTGNSARLEMALTVVKESLKVIARVVGACAPLKAEVKDVRKEATDLHKRVEELEMMLQAYEGELPPKVYDRLDGLHRYVI